MEEKDIQNELASIRNLMERSSKFISLSGLSGILAGIYALIGAGVAYFIIREHPTTASNNSFFENLGNAIYIFYSFCLIGGLVLIASVVTGLILSKRKARKKGQLIWGKTSRELLFHMAIPLITGGLAIIVFLYYGDIKYIIPAMLIFYGLALVSAGNFTFTDIRYLGILEVILGITSAFLPGYGLLFWAIGFGALHIIYGSMMYLKYDR